MTNVTQLDTLRGTILTVDDSPTIRKLVSMTMEGQGYRVVAAADGIEALAILKDESPDLILCDVAMPKLDGYQLCNIIKSSTDTKHIPVVMLSGKDGLFDKVRGKMSGCSSYITKPFEPDLLISEVRKHVKPALIPMSPHKTKKKPAKARSSSAPADAQREVPKTKSTDDSAQKLADQLAGLKLPERDDVMTVSGLDAPLIRQEPRPPEPVSGKADQLPSLPEETQPETSAQPPEPPRKPEPEKLPDISKEGSDALDKLLSSLEQEDEYTPPAPPQEPFRARCPGCRIIFRNVRPDNYDKHARCKKCGERFHLGDNRVT
jgi:twitching motility two-component system response regulator PilG